MVAARPFQIHTLCGEARSLSASGRETADANRIWPRRFTWMLTGDCTASGTLTVCFTANVVGSYSTTSPGARNTQSRLPWASRGDASNTMTPTNNHGLRMKQLYRTEARGNAGVTSLRSPRALGGLCDLRSCHAEIAENCRRG